MGLVECAVGRPGGVMAIPEPGRGRELAEPAATLRAVFQGVHRAPDSAGHARHARTGSVAFGARHLRVDDTPHELPVASNDHSVDLASRSVRLQLCGRRAGHARLQTGMPARAETVLVVYPEAKVSDSASGLVMHPSPPHVPFDKKKPRQAKLTF